MTWLILARALQGVGGGGIFQMVNIVIGDIVPLERCVAVLSYACTIPLIMLQASDIRWLRWSTLGYCIVSAFNASSLTGVSPPFRIIGPLIGGVSTRPSVSSSRKN